MTEPAADVDRHLSLLGIGCSGANVAALAGALASTSFALFSVDDGWNSFRNWIAGVFLALHGGVFVAVLVWNLTRRRFPFAPLLLLLAGALPPSEQWRASAGAVLCFATAMLVSLTALSRTRILSAPVGECSCACAAASGWLFGVAGFLVMASQSYPGGRWPSYGLAASIAIVLAGVAVRIRRDRVQRGPGAPVLAAGDGTGPRATIVPLSVLGLAFAAGLLCAVGTGALVHVAVSKTLYMR